MGYDRDVIVVGGGPAGMNAAIRARWIKRYKAIPCSTLLIENSYLGGLAAWRGCLFTGPSWKMKGKDILRRLQKDLNRFRVDVYQGRVRRIALRGDIKEVFTADGKVFRSLAVIIATGIKVLVNEKDYLGRGLEVTSMGYEFIVSHLKKLLKKKWEPRLVIVGSSKLINLIPLIRSLNTGGSPLLFIMEEEGKESGDIVHGWVEQYWGDGRLQGVTLLTPHGRREIPCGRALLDFNSYELSPTCRMDFVSGYINSPFIQVDQEMQTAIPGIFAAGDVTRGGFNSFSKAVSQGMTAGLSAYRYIYQKKFSAEPFLFAYRPTDFSLTPHFRELPPLNEELCPKSLIQEEEIRSILGESWSWLVEELHGDSSLQGIAARRNVRLADLKKILNRLVEKKAVTFHVKVDQ